jgi:hypothetical protein
MPCSNSLRTAGHNTRAIMWLVCWVLTQSAPHSHPLGGGILRSREPAIVQQQRFTQAAKIRRRMCEERNVNAMRANTDILSGRWKAGRTTEQLRVKRLFVHSFVQNVTSNHLHVRQSILESSQSINYIAFKQMACLLSCLQQSAAGCYPVSDYSSPQLISCLFNL